MNFSLKCTNVAVLPLVALLVLVGCNESDESKKAEADQESSPASQVALDKPDAVEALAIAKPVSNKKRVSTKTASLNEDYGDSLSDFNKIHVGDGDDYDVFSRSGSNAGSNSLLMEIDGSKSNSSGSRAGNDNGFLEYDQSFGN